MTLLTGGANFLRYILFLFNFFFVITGIILISVGVTVGGVYNDYHVFLTTKFFSIPTFLIVIGCFIFFISFFGCYGAMKENYCLILTFIGLLCFIFILELAAGISGYVLRNKTAVLIREQLYETIPIYRYPVGERDDVKILWDIVQKKFDCCGVDSYKDWEQTFNNLIPFSCCEVPPGSLNNFNCTTSSDSHVIRSSGCLNLLADFIMAHTVSLGAAGIFIAMIQFAGIFFAGYVAREIKIKYGGGNI